MLEAYLLGDYHVGGIENLGRGVQSRTSCLLIYKKPCMAKMFECCIYMCSVTHLGHICSSFPVVKASCCEGSSLHERLALWAASLLWVPAAEGLPLPDQTLRQSTLGPHEHHCSAMPSADHSNSVDDSYVQHNWLNEQYLYMFHFLQYLSMLSKTLHIY